MNITHVIIRNRTMSGNGCFEKEDRERFVRMETILQGLSEVMFSDTGAARCATNMEKIETLEKSVENSKKWVKGIVVAVSGSAFVLLLTILYDLLRAVPKP